MLLEANNRTMLVNGDQWACWSGYHIPVSEDYFVIWTPTRYVDALEARNMAG